MAQFYTHLLDDRGYLTDAEGSDFVDLKAARRAAIAAGAAIIADELADGRTTVQLTFEIHGPDGRCLATVPITGSVGDEEDRSFAELPIGQ